MPSHLTTSGRSRGIAVALLLLLLAVPAVLLAHAHLARSTPASGQRLTASPTAISLWFTERPQIAFTAIALSGPQGAIPLGTLQELPGSGVTAALSQSLGSGQYVIAWKTVAADGHPSNGRFGFTVRLAGATTGAAPIPAPAVATPNPAIITPQRATDNSLVQLDRQPSADTVDQQAVTRWVEFVALLCIVGAIVFRLALLPRVATRGFALTDGSESARRLAQAALVLVLLGLLSRLYIESLLLNGPAQVLGGDALDRLLLDTSWGHGWIVGAAGVVVVIVGLFIASRATAGWIVAAVGASALVLAPSLTGHAAADPSHPLSAIIVDALHVFGASAWLGTLLVLVLVGVPCVLRLGAETRGNTIAALVNAFHPIALAGAALVVATGVANACFRLTAFSDFWTTPYGRMLVLKLVLVCFIIGFGAFNSRRMRPSLGDDDSPRRFRRSAAGELLFAIAVLAVTAVLVGTPTP